MENPAFILGDGSNALSVIRGLGRASIQTHLFGAGKDDIASHSRYPRVTYLPESANPEAVIQQVCTASHQYSNRPVLLFTSDKYLEIVSSNRGELSKYCDFVIPSAEAVKRVLDKTEFSHFCAHEKLPAPQSWSPVSAKQVESCIDQIRFPAVIKPIFAHKAEETRFNNKGKFAKMILVNSEVELCWYFSVLAKQGATVLIQECINGPDNEHYSYCSYRNSENKELVSFCIRKHRIYPVHGGAGTFAEVIDDDEIVEIGRSAVEKLNYKGVSSVCFKRDTTTGRLMIHEINGRFPMVHSASQMSGVNIPLIVYQDTIGTSSQAVSINNKCSGKWILLNSDINAYRGYSELDELSLLAWLTSLFQVRYCVEFDMNDLRPFFFMLRNIIKRIVRKIDVYGLTGNDKNGNSPDLTFRRKP